MSRTVMFFNYFILISASMAYVVDGRKKEPSN
jgi:hypothetical protein